MQTSLEKTSSTLGKVTIKIEEADYQSGVKKTIKEYAKTAQVKGFRVGHVPAGYINKIYGKSIMIDEVVKLVNSELSKAIEENKLNVVGEPIPVGNEAIDWNKDKEFVFEYNLGFTSDFEVDLTKLPKVKHYSIEPTEDAVNESIENIKNRFADEIQPEVSEPGDIVFGELTQESTEFFFQSGIPTDKVKEDSKDKFLGLKEDDTLSFDIKTIFESDKELGFATGKSDEEAAALEGEFNFKVTRISRVIPADMDQDLFDKALGEGEVSNEADFKEKVKSIIKENYDREADIFFGYQVEDALLDNVEMELPEEFIREFLIEVNKGKATEEEVDQDLPKILKGIKMDLIRSTVAKENELEVKYEDMVDEAKAEIRGYFGGQSFQGMEDFINNMAEKQLKETKDPEQNRKYFERALGRKVIDFVKDKVEKDTESVSLDKFNEIATAAYSA